MTPACPRSERRPSPAQVSSPASALPTEQRSRAEAHASPLPASRPPTRAHATLHKRHARARLPAPAAAAAAAAVPRPRPLPRPRLSPARGSCWQTTATGAASATRPRPPPRSAANRQPTQVLRSRPHQQGPARGARRAARVSLRNCGRGLRRGRARCAVRFWRRHRGQSGWLRAQTCWFMMARSCELSSAPLLTCHDDLHHPPRSAESSRITRSTATSASRRRNPCKESTEPR